ncbi:glycosyltransferase [Hufsiella ginkgonis]|uniref:Glycosyltransferase n=1 Tax=Hufsiella ginkgonis TaxID=2695274 RepID=A0A7K1Y3H3_9SPHI|nr:glycosyltransferase [Hufsiella ginkgonis]MXV17844.1 glycosyltransferase [Hufsiella ginkgonis]
MNLAFVASRPTQFEAPFFRFVATIETGHHLQVFYLDSGLGYRDPETNCVGNWGIDLFAGYDHHLLDPADPMRDFAGWLSAGFAMVILNGYQGAYADLVRLCRRNHTPAALRLDTVLFNKSRINLLLRRLLLPHVYRQFDHYLAAGNASKNYLEKMGIAHNLVNIFGYCIDHTLFASTQPSPHPRDKIPVLLVVAKFIPRENPMEALMAFCALNRKDLRLIMVGDGILGPALSAYANRFPWLDIRFPGYLPYTQLAALFRAATIFIHAAKDEPWGVSVHEAIAGGCRIICSDRVGSAYDLVKQGKNGFIYPSGDINALTRAIPDALSLDNNLVDETNAAVISAWSYLYMWNELLLAAARCTETGSISPRQTNPLLAKALRAGYRSRGDPF